MTTYTTQAELYRKGWSTLRCLRLGSPDCVLVATADAGCNGVEFPANQYPALRAQHGTKAQRAWCADRVMADEIKRQVLASKAS